MTGTLPASEWQRLARQLEQRARELLANARPTPGWLARNRSLATQIELLTGMAGADVEAAGRLYGEDFVPTLLRARDAAVSALPAEVAVAAAEFSAFVGPATLSPVLATAIVARTREAILSDWDRLSVEVRDRVANTIARGIASGDGNVVTARSIAAEAGFTRQRASTIARTEYASAQDEVRHQTMRQLGIDQWVWKARPDACPICASLHGEVFSVYEAAGRHPNCRCIMVPKVDGVRMPQPPDPAVVAQLFPRRLAGQIRRPGDARRALTVADNPKWKPSWRVKAGQRLYRRPHPAPTWEPIDAL